MLIDINNPNCSSRDIAASYHLSVEKLQQTISQLYQIDKPDEIDFLTALFIEQLANSLELNSIPSSLAASSIPLVNFPPLPVDFPDSMEMPLYLYGDRVFHESIEDCAIIIGRFSAFERVSKQWRWKYLILKSQDSTVNSFLSSRVCWETELQPINLSLIHI